MRTRKKYMCGQKRGGTSPRATDTSCPPGKNRKDYHKQETSFHGGEMAYEAYVKAGRRGYGQR